MTAIKIHKQLALIRSMPKTMLPSERFKHSIKEVGADSFIKVRGVTYKVEEVHRYSEDNKDEWFELKLISLVDGEVLFLEWEEDDEIEVFLNDKSLKLRDIGLTQAELTEMDDEEEGEFSFNGRAFYYDDSNKALFFRNNQGEGEKFYYWDFFNKEGSICIGVERWGSEYEVSVGHKIALNDIEILVLGG